MHCSEILATEAAKHCYRGHAGAAEVSRSGQLFTYVIAAQKLKDKPFI